MTTPVLTNQCRFCKHWVQSPMMIGKVPVCLAFPEGIPDGILEGDFDHRKPYAGDNGYRFIDYRKDSEIDATPQR